VCLTSGPLPVSGFGKATQLVTSRGGLYRKSPAIRSNEPGHLHPPKANPEFEHRDSLELECRANCIWENRKYTRRPLIRKVCLHLLNFFIAQSSAISQNDARRAAAHRNSRIRAATPRQCHAPVLGQL
jgi:hypothetical protein